MELSKTIGYAVLADCTLDATNFYKGENIFISEHQYDSDWKGTDFFDAHSLEFEPITEPNENGWHTGPYVFPQGYFD